ncbi:MAG: hypothetical protein Ct9H300mP32_3850 [Verrucomicrobiota bacterium]|nr:MAG: hypothetical protein Ct9H300mP32_3850 [Verrucomicrobiota bacterium]
MLHHIAGARVAKGDGSVGTPGLLAKDRRHRLTNDVAAARMTTSAPSIGVPERISNSCTPPGVHGTKPPLSPSISLPTFTG